MKPLLLLLLLIIVSSFTPRPPKKAYVYESPNLDKIMIYIPAMSFNYQEFDLMKEYPDFDKAVVVSVKEFYISPYEVSNGQFLEYLKDLKKAGDTNIYKAALPDTLVWRSKHAYNEPYVDYYLRHPAYAEYPVVGVTHKQCELYCEWLTKKYNETEKRKFKKVKFRLPTKQEWYASAVFIPTDKKSSAKDLSIGYISEFPWEGPYMRNKEGKPMANFAIIQEGSVHREYDSVMTVYGVKDLRMRLVCSKGYEYYSVGLRDASDITAPVRSYWPNRAGMYNLAGNVEEFVSEYGITKGGSWYDPGFYLRNCSVESYDSTDEASETRGFRFAMEVIEE